MRARNVFEKRDSEAFAHSLERIFGAGLAAHGVQPYLIRHRLPSPETVHIEIVLHSAFDLPLVERFIEEEFIRAPGRPCEERPAPFCDLSPIESTLRLSPVRQDLPEWRDFAEAPFLVTINTLFGEAFRAALSYLSGTEHGEGLHRSGEKLQELYDLAKQLDGGFSRLFGSFEKTEQELALPESPSPFEKTGGAPALPKTFEAGGFGKPASSEDQTPSPSEADFPAEGAAAVLSGRNTTLERLALIAEESGIPLSGPLPPFRDLSSILEAEGFRHLAAELGKRGLNTAESLEAFFQAELSDWEDLYARFETARLKGLLDRGPVSLLRLVSLLVQSAGGN